MSFGDSSFLPLRFNFSTTPCEGQLIAKFTTPAEVPNGEADIFWQCAGLAPYCYQANITNGTSDPTMQLDREAQVGCINEITGDITHSHTPVPVMGHFWGGNTIIYSDEQGSNGDGHNSRPGSDC
ncbi:hypothetical protein MAA_11167 [Metarhizium robertsii ARSEF 23]|uniref:Uncharacterized protein n=1 Tax=Metarhizium robertsii (strain ARSEF 23 / ATCC MYA-3075) TaxID=655844 RepID=A0A0B2XIL2_METRA|nr:uncharacterized protein MAA_11167 [Metarhizium robertsii ARSEF 23]KHO11352.1 hypothetical protein MAA_11167 [Metarhizium robertsii ARSEF 23]